MPEKPKTQKTKTQLEIPEHITGHELNRNTKIQLKSLNKENSTLVAKYLVMAQILSETDTKLAYKYAKAAAKQASRISAVREAVAKTAYLNQDYQKAITEFRTFRRMTNSNTYNLEIATCELKLERPEKALEVIKTTNTTQLSKNQQIQLKIVEATARLALNENKAALTVLSIPELNPNRAFTFSPQLFYAYSKALAANGKHIQAEIWNTQAEKAAEAITKRDNEPEMLELLEPIIK